MINTDEYSTQLACALNGYRALIVPGLHNSDAQHWQSLWERTIPRTSRIRLHDWHTADWVKWRNSIIASLISIDEPVVFIAEGFGALAAASVAAEYPAKVIALFLVDPADADQFDIRKKLPKKALPVPTKIVIRESFNTEAGANSALLALLWNADFHQATDDSQGESSTTDYWPTGIQALNNLVSCSPRDHKDLIQAKTKKILAYLRAIKKYYPAGEMHYQHG
jgi:predicted alpha/beta hydrolase family esterase